MSQRILSLEIRLEPDVVLARQRARQIAALFGFPPLDQTRIATVASEMARNVYHYAGGGRVKFLLESGATQNLVIQIIERGPGTQSLQAVLDSENAQPNGRWLAAIRRLMDRFETASEPGGGVTVTLAKKLPRGSAPITAKDLSRISNELARNAPRGLLDELQQQNQELIRALQELRDQQADVMELHRRELEETNRGVVALYTELDDYALALKKISDMKSRFLSNMSHEFRSPLDTILRLTGFLNDRSDGDLSSEQEKQVFFIKKAAEGLLSLVNDLLDLAKMEAGKAVVRPKSFTVADLFASLKGTIGPLLGAGAVTLDFEEPKDALSLQTDDAKVAQILRNFLSNAIKFTERGEIRLVAAPGPGDTVVFTVSDTGVGIAPGDMDRVFEEFGQIEGPLQGRVKGTGLGLPLSRKLAEVLGGSVSVRSEPGVGSTFSVVLPRVYRDRDESGKIDDEKIGEAPIRATRSVSS